DIAVVHKGGVEGTKMLALGGRAFTKRLADKLGKSFEDAERVKLKYSADRLSPEAMVKIKELFEGDVRVWLSGVELALSEFRGIDLLPSKIFLCGGGSLLPGIKEALLSPHWVENLPFARQPKVSYIEPSNVRDVVDKTGKLKEASDITPMTLANVAIELAGEEGVVSKILRSVVGVIQT
ncbi:MAG: cell division protein (septum formation), partial [uncultured bacterium]